MARYADDPYVDEAPASRRRRFWRRDPYAAEREREDTVAGAEGAAILIARLISIVAGVVCVIIALAAAFIVLDANTGNSIVSHVLDWGKGLAGPFDGMFHLDSAKTSVALNYAIAIIVYLFVAGLLIRLVLAPVGVSRRRWW
jgi:uncharacterized Tic20 family protein